MRKKLLSFTICLCLCAGTAISVMADPPPANPEISVLRGEECGKCGLSGKGI